MIMALTSGQSRKGESRGWLEDNNSEPKGESTLTSVSRSSLVPPSDLAGAGQASIAGPSVELTTKSRCASALLESILSHVDLLTNTDQPRGYC